MASRGRSDKFPLIICDSSHYIGDPLPISAPLPFFQPVILNVLPIPPYCHRIGSRPRAHPLPILSTQKRDIFCCEHAISPNYDLNFVASPPSLLSDTIPFCFLLNCHTFISLLILFLTKLDHPFSFHVTFFFLSIFTLSTVFVC